MTDFDDMDVGDIRDAIKAAFYAGNSEHAITLSMVLKERLEITSI